MPLPHAVARFNKRATNRFIEPIARRTPGFAVVHHTGRRTGRRYATPVNIFGSARNGIVALTYGPKASWVQNVLAGEASIETRKGWYQITAVEIVGRDIAWPSLPGFVRIALRVLQVRHFAHLETTPTSSLPRLAAGG